MTHALTVFGQKCRELRIAKGATMGDQSTALKLGAAEISAIETGDRRPTAEYIAQFASWLKLSSNSTTELISIAMRQSNVVAFRPKKSDSIKLFRKIGGMKPEEIRKLRNIAEQEVTRVR